MNEPISNGEPSTGGRWRLHPRVALRPEPFGALAYHYDSRTLNFLRSSELVAVVKELENHLSARTAFDAIGVAEERWSAFASALNALARSEFIEPLQSMATTPDDTSAVVVADANSTPITGGQRA